MATAACMSLVLTMMISSCGLAFCSDPELIGSPVMPLDPACRARWGHVTETCCQSGGGHISYRYRVPRLFSPHSYIGDGPLKTCKKDGLPPCPECAMHNACGYKTGAWVFEAGAWSKAQLPSASLDQTSNASHSGDAIPRKTCSKEKFKPKCPGNCLQSSHVRLSAPFSAIFDFFDTLSPVTL